MNQFLHEITPLVSHYGLWVVFFGMMIEGTMMIIVSGILCYLGLLSVKETIPVAILGAIAGDQLWYLLGRYYAGRVLDRFPTLKQKVEKLASAVQSKGDWLAFGARFIYSGAIVFPLTLGVYRYPHPRFTFFDAIGVTLWSIAGITIGYLLGTGAEQIFGEIKKVEHLLLLIVIVGVAVWLIGSRISKNIR